MRPLSYWKQEFEIFVGMWKRRWLFIKELMNVSYTKHPGYFKDGDVFREQGRRYRVTTVTGKPWPVCIEKASPPGEGFVQFPPSKGTNGLWNGGVEMPLWATGINKAPYHEREEE